MEKGWKIVLILFVLLAAIGITIFLLIKFEVIKGKQINPDCMATNICYFTSMNVQCNSNYDCDSKQLSSLHSFCDLSKEKCAEFTDRRITSKEECSQKGGKWGLSENC
ncbi:MAG TPA: hypothetical protein PK357_02695 [Candidatus Pacearchaeota archaeon]|nr:hypothetical protein [Candidatus Pacearchaeota archaeon]